MPDAERLETAYRKVRRDLLALRDPSGHWTGELSTSALSTATAISALVLYQRNKPTPVGPFEADDALPPLDTFIDNGLRWLTKQQNHDGGWGDTDRSFSNIATTMLVKAAFHIAGRAEAHAEMLAKADEYLAAKGGLAGLRARYGKDKTFAVPILTNCALAGLVPWREVSSLPFELACLPQSWYRFLNLPVVSYALPALIAIGQVRYQHRKPWNPLLWFARSAAVEPSLKVLRKIQPASGGFLEATPLTSFVVMSLIGSGRSDHPVVRSGVRFIIESVRPDGSWPIDTNLATWNTTLSINALAAGGENTHELGNRCLRWLLSCQHREVHPYTGAAPGGWAWTNLTGGVPDADDTPGALLALAHWLHSAPDGALSPERTAEIRNAAGRGVSWLLSLQNDDGGWPTFCRGWGALPFDRSGTDLTAHVLRAFSTWAGNFATGTVSPQLQAHLDRFDARIGQAIRRGFAYLARQQREDGSWFPLWFGNQYHADEENPVYGTSRVLLAYRDLHRIADPVAAKAFGWLASQQNSDGGWGNVGAERGRSIAPEKSGVEETALAVEALLAAPPETKLQGIVEKGLDWLLRVSEEDRHRECSPIGFYFAKLWYYEKTYPLVLMLSALGRARRDPTASHTETSPKAHSACT